MADTLTAAQIVEKVVEDLDARAVNFKERGDPREIFTFIYRNITRRMLSELPGFSDPNRLAKLLRIFAEKYMIALDAPETPRVWDRVFKAIGVGKSTTGDLSTLEVFGALILPMVAHIRHDLVFALHDLGATPGNEFDHERVTDLLCEEVDHVQNTKAEFAPGLGVLNFAFGPLNESFTCRIVRGMRQQAWEDAQALLAAPTEAERAAIKKRVEEETLEVINGIVPLLSGWISLLDILKALLSKLEDS